jgi:ElaA protein
MDVQVKRFEQLSTKELYDILKLRVDVFVVEQKCPYEEVDGKDLQAWHVWLQDEDGIEAYLRVLDPGVVFPEAAIGRVIARKRGQQLGARVLAAGIRTARERLHASAVRIEAQVYAKGFYEKAGFQAVSEPFLEDGIPHVQMLLKLEEPHE